MTQFTITIDDPTQLEGISWARGKYNNGQDRPIKTDDEYLQFAVEKVVASYALGMVQETFVNKINDAVASGDIATLKTMSEAISNVAAAPVKETAAPPTVEPVKE